MGFPIYLIFVSEFLFPISLAKYNFEIIIVLRLISRYPFLRLRPAACGGQFIVSLRESFDVGTLVWQVPHEGKGGKSQVNTSLRPIGKGLVELTSKTEGLGRGMSGAILTVGKPMNGNSDLTRWPQCGALQVE